MLALAASGCSAVSAEDDVVEVYSARHYDLEQAFQQFSEETGVQVEFLYGTDAELRERIEAEGEDTPADVYMTVDAGNLALAAEQGIFQPIRSEVLTGAVPSSSGTPTTAGSGWPSGRAPSSTTPEWSTRPSCPRTKTSPTRGGTAGCACAVPPRRTPRRWWRA
jgi:hypothetical protein